VYYLEVSLPTYIRIISWCITIFWVLTLGTEGNINLLSVGRFEAGIVGKAKRALRSGFRVLAACFPRDVRPCSGAALRSSVPAKI
jgi:hypothetical protein